MILFLSGEMRQLLYGANRINRLYPKKATETYIVKSFLQIFYLLSDDESGPSCCVTTRLKPDTQAVPVKRSAVDHDSDRVNPLLEVDRSRSHTPSRSRDTGRFNPLSISPQPDTF